MPQPYRGLLVHRNDMTPTLEAFHGGPIHLRLLGKRRDGDRLFREVVLTLSGSGLSVEFGAIVIHCDRFPHAAREEILGCHSPLGSILAVHGIGHSSRPQAFFAVDSEEVINESLGLNAPCKLYGRKNVLLDPHERVLAEVIEILPPMAEPGGDV
jgi:chorismate-pyruvate lyase